MKQFALFISGNEQPTIIEGQSAIIKRKKDGLYVTINLGGKNKVTFSGVIIFTELSKSIKVL